MEHSSSSALDVARRVRAREVSVTEVVQEALTRAYADPLAAYTHVAAEDALSTAAGMDARLADPAFQPGPLFGVPCPIKDLAQVEGWPFEAGSPVYAGNRATRDDGVVTRLREAGLVLIGKTATPEFGLPCYTEPEGRQSVATPFDPTRNAGGSSGGAAAAVAGGSVPIAHGSDGGGSIRIPAACCGLVGLKASRGRISKGPHGVDGPGLVSEGVLTRDVADTAVALDLLSRGWAGDPFPVDQPRGTFLDACRERPTGLNVGVLTEPVICDQADVHPEAVVAVERVAAMLESLGHRVESAPRPFGEQQWSAFAALWSVGALSVPVPAGREEDLRPLTRWLRDRGRECSGLAYASALTSAQEVARVTAQAWDSFDIVLTPTLAQPPARHGELRDDGDPEADFWAQTRFTPWTSVYNITGRPAITLPLHTAEIDGVELPFGVMLGSRVHADALLLAVAGQLEEAAG